MQGDIDQYGFERLQLTSLADLDRLVAERFELPPRPYSTDIRAAFELVVWALEHDEYPYFAIFRSEDEAFPDKPFGVGFAPKTWSYGETAAVAICREALYQLKQVKVDLALSQS
jgi:hypothetical protein